jgi:hypothetical protein
MLNEYAWKTVNEKLTYSNTKTGKVMGSVLKQNDPDSMYAFIYIDDLTNVVEDERNLGNFKDLNSAKSAVEYFWEVEYRFF